MSFIGYMRGGILAAAMTCGGAVAFAQDVALVISNAASLKGSVAEDVEDGHRQLVSLYRDMGYDVMQGRDLNRQGIRRMLSEFSRAAQGGDGKIVIHFSGRAVTIGNETLIIPVGLEATDRTGVIFEAVPLTALLSTASSREGDTAIVLALNAQDDPDFASFATRPFKVEAPDNALVVYGTAGQVNRAVKNQFLIQGLSAAEVDERNDRINLKGRVTRSMRLVPSGRNAVGGIVFAEQALWALASSTNDRALIRAYLQRFPNGANAGEARRLLGGNSAEDGERAIGLTDDARRVIQRNLTILGYNTRGIDGIFGPGTRGSIREWQKTRDLNATGYLRQPQIAKLKADADKRRQEIKAAEWRRKQEDTAFWQRTGKNNTKPLLIRYLQRYPNGVHSRQAKALLKQIRTREEASARAEDRSAWRAARDANTIRAYRRYLNQNDNGQFRDRAEEAIEDLRGAERRVARREAYRSEENALGLSKASVRRLERRLASLEFAPGRVDGDITQDTRQALRGFQSSQELEVTGFFNGETVLRLLAVSNDDDND